VLTRVKCWLLCVSIWFGIPPNSVFFCMNRMLTPVPLESVGENFVEGFPGIQFQAHEAPLNF
jgi:hypothetical protein